MPLRLAPLGATVRPGMSPPDLGCHRLTWDAAAPAPGKAASGAVVAGQDGALRTCPAGVLPVRPGPGYRRRRAERGAVCAAGRAERSPSSARPGPPPPLAPAPGPAAGEGERAASRGLRLVGTMGGETLNRLQGFKADAVPRALSGTDAAFFLLSSAPKQPPSRRLQAT